MMKKLIYSTVAVVGMVGSANAAIVNATADCEIGLTPPAGVTCATDNARRNLGNVEFSTAGDGDFFSLGLGGSATFEINPQFTGNGVVVEVTFGGASSSHNEAAEIYVSSDGVNFSFVTTVDNQGSTSSLQASMFNVGAGPFSFIRFIDVSQTTFSNTRSSDGFDIDAFSVQAVPIPAGALLLPTGLIALQIARRKRRA
ncbi:VPLPA-CTERM sorting domain-containing protein [Parvularcula lutaonensis]|uniref:VPLPA-CTERM sorting domain-containing protein n=1 Tax=Parvularcula lutaonensis TaxID=491923 RepID=A0ABV7MFU9_9PROT|nr:VPLPA-CTERM sorting domain-containing protein [Parvularcula lutaonensis]GGY55409.1 hypothetical protein GCM10007148_26620 [Parvularcula lutaonensis]